MTAPSGKWKAYPTYKPSGVEWPGEIPAHWRVKRFKQIARLIYGDSLPMEGREDGDVPVYGSNGIVGYHSTPNTKAPALVIGRKGSYGKVNYASQPSFAIDTTYFVDQRSSSECLRWLYYALELLGLDAYSEDSAVPGVSRDYVYSRSLPVPPGSDQEAIAAFLDRETAKIDALVAKKERLIELLQEKRAALITQTVTKGLNPSAPMKDSGVEWLGAIPAHWEVKRLKFASHLQTGVTLGKDYGDRTLVARPYLRVANVQDGYLDLSDITEIDVPMVELRRYELRRGDVLMTEGGDFDKLGRGHVWQEQIPGCLHQNHIFAVRPDSERLASRYLSSLMTSAYGKAYFTATSQQTTNLASTNSMKIKSFPAPLPSLEEQRTILGYLDREASEVDTLIAKIRGHMEKLREYRVALISATVTGKFDVRDEVTA